MRGKLIHAVEQRPAQELEASAYGWRTKSRTEEASFERALRTAVYAHHRAR